MHILWLTWIYSIFVFFEGKKEKKYGLAEIRTQNHPFHSQQPLDPQYDEQDLKKKLRDQTKDYHSIKGDTLGV